MEIKCRRFLGWVLLLLIMVMIESCSGCSHSGRRSRDRHQERVERRESNEDRGVRSGSRRSRSSKSHGFNSRKYSEEDIAAIAEGDDYDAMLDCQFAKLNELKQLKDEYFHGEMSDKKAEERMKEIEDKFAPVDKALDVAQREGSLNYNQHKRQMKLMGDYLKVIKTIASRLGSDISSSIDI